MFNTTPPYEKRLDHQLQTGTDIFIQLECVEVNIPLLCVMKHLHLKSRGKPSPCYVLKRLHPKTRSKSGSPLISCVNPLSIVLRKILNYLKFMILFSIFFY